MRLVLAALMGAGILAVGFATLRSLGRPAPHGSAPADAAPIPPDVRITYWCETCGAEVLLLRKGTDSPPRHCGESMVRRQEVLRGN
jgi:hypothetical protein